MKTFYLIPFLIFCFSCTNDKNNTEEENPKNNEIVIADFQSLLDSANVKGSIMIYDLNDDKFYSNDFEWANRGNLPASTFKITNSIIALETGVINDDSTLIKWDGKKRRLKHWEQDLIFRDALHFSCVPCYQEIAKEIGSQRMNKYLDKLEYGDMKVDSSNIDMFWLEGESRISQKQQIDFIKRFYQSRLPISKRTEGIMKRMLVMEDNNENRISGKTGWSVTNGINNGWFVGYLETQSKTYFFASNIEPKNDSDIANFASTRKNITFDALDVLRK